MFYVASIYALLNAVVLVGVTLTFGMVGFFITAGTMFIVLLLGIMGLMIASEARTIAAKPRSFARTRRAV